MRWVVAGSMLFLLTSLGGAFLVSRALAPDPGPVVASAPVLAGTGQLPGLPGPAGSGVIPPAQAAPSLPPAPAAAGPALKPASRAEARSAVLAMASGTVVSVTRARHDGRSTWQVTLRRSDGSVLAGFVDRASGGVLDWVVVSPADQRGTGQGASRPAAPGAGTGGSQGDWGVPEYEQGEREADAPGEGQGSHRDEGEYDEGEYDEGADD